MPAADTAVSRSVPAPEAPQTVSEPPTVPEAPTVSTPSGYYATSSGKKYHVAGCSYLNGKTPVSVSAEDIASGKYTPCSKCIK